MDADQGAHGGQGPNIDQESFIREIASLRTYLLFVAGKLPGIQFLRVEGVSDLVDSVIKDALTKVRQGDGDLRFWSDKQLKSWLVNRLRWTYRDRVERQQQYDRILRLLPPPQGPASPSSEAARAEQARLQDQARAKLDSADRRLIQWRFDEDLTFKEIGRERECSTSYARRAWLRAWQTLELIYRNIGRTPSR
jgi:RNA polymerase sigma factor (sigma-70 family)